jgi:chromosome partitioning protein
MAISDSVKNRGVLGTDARRLSAQLRAQREQIFPTSGQKALRTFSSTEAAALLGVGDSYLRQLSLDGQGPAPEVGAGRRRAYTLGQINELRALLLDKRGGDKIISGRRKPQERMQVLSVANFKGGSGKTTTAAHLAQYLALHGYRVLAIDLDPQASLTSLHGIQPELDVGIGESLYGAIRYESRRSIRDVIRKTYFDGLDIIPANIELMEFEHETPLNMRRGGSSFFSRVLESLAEVEPSYDVVVIDCPPQLGYLTLSALCASSGLIVTVHPQMLDVTSMCQFLMMLDDLLEVMAGTGEFKGFEIIRYLITRYEPTDGPQTQMVAFVRSMFEQRVLTSPMLKSTTIADAGLSKQTLYELGRESFVRATYDRAIEALDAVNREIEGLLKASWGRA